jgi:hypothetical protein
MLEIDKLELEQCVKRTKWSSHHSIGFPREGKTNKKKPSPWIWIALSV